jgi:protein involved in polysaccharide export with SLBB domain
VLPTLTRAIAARLLAMLAAAVVLAAPAGAQEQEPTLAPGDVVRITVFRKPELTGEIDVAENGSLVHPLYRDLRAAGLTGHQLEERLAAYLTRYEANPAFVVEPLVRLTISGEVRQPQVYVMPPSTTVFQAVAKAGGVAPTGRSTRVLLVRDGQTRVLDLSQPGAPGAGERVRSGDLVVVERRSTWARDVLTPAAALASVVISLINLLSTS